MNAARIVPERTRSVGGLKVGCRHAAAMSLILLVLSTAIPVPVSAEVFCPRVTSEHNADVTDLHRFRQFARWRDKQGEPLAIAVWQYLCDRETGLYHMNAVFDGPDPWQEYSTVRDPIKLLNIYNVGYCGIFGPVLDGVFQGIGFSDGRAFGVSGWNHCTTEVWYDDSWHYFDLDVRGALVKPDGSVASLAEARQHRELWTCDPPRIEPFFPKDRDKNRVFEIYRDSQIDYFYRWFQMGHVMDFTLRQGESLTRWWHPQGRRWHHVPAYNQGFVRQLLEKDPPGYKSNHPDFSVWTQGNGLWDFQPNLTDRSNDFVDGAYRSENVKPGVEGLCFQSNGRGKVVFEVFTPWIIVPEVGDLDDPNDDRGASIIDLEIAEDTEVAVSLDQGRSWQPVGTFEPGRHAVDLTQWVKGTYGYLVRFQSRGKAAALWIQNMRIRTWVQVAPISLPRLKQGVNHCRYEMGDRYDRLTRPVFIHPNTADPSDLAKYVVALPEDYDPQRRSARIQGDVVLRLTAPEGSLIDWFTPGACFRTYQGEQASKTDNRIAMAVDAPKGFKEIYRADVPTWVNHWRYQWDQDVRLDTPAREVYVRYTGRPAVNVIRATVHLRPEKKPERAIRVTYGYRLGGQLHEEVVQLDEPGEYTVTVDGEPENVFIKMAVPSSRTAKAGRPVSAPLTPVALVQSSDEPDWIEAMRSVHARSQGEQGVLVHLGDSITYSMAYFAPLQYAADAKMDEPTREAWKLVKDYLQQPCYRWKGPDKGNYSGQTAAWALKHVDEWLQTLKPEAAVIMFGTNDIRRGTIERHEENLRALIRKCLDAGVVVILSTIPPMHGFDDKVRETVDRQRRLAEQFKIPLIDFHAHVLARRPDDWDGTLPQFNQYSQWQVPTLISRDGVHPSNPDRWRKDYTEAGLHHNGNVLRTYLTLMAYAEVIRTVFQEQPPSEISTKILGAEPPVPPAPKSSDGESRSSELVPSTPHHSPSPWPAWLEKPPPLPKPTGPILRAGSVDELYSAVENVPPGGTILLADGTYYLPRTLTIHTDGVTLRSASGDRRRVILDFSRSRHHEGVAISHCQGVTVADLTVQNVRQNGIKINSNYDVDRVTIRNVISHNVWQRHIKGPAVPDRNGSPDFAEGCRIEYCLFYNDRPKQRGDEPWEDANPRMGFNYIGGIDVMCAKDWVIRNNVFTGIHGKTGEARGAVFLWHNATNCVVERNVIIDCDTGICLGNSSARGPRRHANGCVVRNNFVIRCPESNILADHTRDCKILHNSVHDPESRSGRLLRVVHANDGLLVANNIFSGPRIVLQQEGLIDVKNNLIAPVSDYFVDPEKGDLHLTERATKAIDCGTRLLDATEDFDGQRRDERTDLGADERVVTSSRLTVPPRSP